MATFTGTSGNDIYTGGAEDDFAHGGAGNDTLSGGDGNDHLAGEDGSDTLNGGTGDDALASGNVQADWDSGFYVYYEDASLDTGTEKDTIVAGDGSDHIWAGYGDNVDGGADGGYGDYFSISFLGAPTGITANFSLASQTIGGGVIKNVENLDWVQGSNFDDTINASDRSYGYTTFGTVLGMGGNDHLIAGYYTDTLDGGDGNDIVDGRGSQYLNAVIGGAGDDTLYTNSNTFASADGGAGNDTIYAHDEVSGGDGNDTIVMQNSYYGGLVSGDAGDDTITAAATGNTIAGGSGADHITGGSAGDNIGSGDFLPGSSNFADDTGLEHDVLNGEGGDDRLSAGYGDDIDGGDGFDILRLSLAGATAGVAINTHSLIGTVTIGGGTIQNIERVDYLLGSAFADTITVGTQESAILIDAGAGNDTITTTGSSANVLGGAGNDRLISGPAADTFDGGDGVDTVDYQKASAGVTVALGLQGAAGSGGGGDQLTNVENVYGSAFADTLTGNEGANVLKGGDGNDKLYGDDGNDTLQGDAGIDKMYGGTGNDTYVVGDSTDYAIEYNSEGTDTVKASVSYTLSSYVENLTLTGLEAISGTGNSLANVITGNAAANTLLGGGGNDRLIGGGGLDHLDGQAGNDVYFFNGSGDHPGGEISDTGTTGVDTVLFSLSAPYGQSTLTLYSQDSGIEQVVVDPTSYVGALSVDATLVQNALTIVGNNSSNVLTGTAFDDTIQGGGSVDYLYGNGGNDRLDGGTDVDRMYGGTGDDTYVVDNSFDFYGENAGEGTDTVLSSVSLTLRANVEDLVLTGSAVLNATGNDLDNAIIGNGATNTLSGGNGTDTIGGGGGNDTLRGDAGDDSLTGGAGRDTIYGGTGADRFHFGDGDFSGLTNTTADRIVDFSQTDGDRIDLHSVDAQTGTTGDQDFLFVGSAAFSHAAGELRFEQVGANTYVSGDTNGDGAADFMVRLDGLHTLTAADFVL